MGKEEIKIVKELEKKGFITSRDSLNQLMILAIKENEKKIGEIKKKSIEAFRNQKIMTKHQFLERLTIKLKSY
ncbi:hypothetical protein [Aquimarina longa]|uniref:hypothetical protein n=1 Tax=Aquimarina longa TaxID=1080221 RepID=UPI000A9B4690|nr:hypothetical protein [Aquimarina longa]